MVHAQRRRTPTRSQRQSHSPTRPSTRHRSCHLGGRWHLQVFRIECWWRGKCRTSSNCHLTAPGGRPTECAKCSYGRNSWVSVRSEQQWTACWDAAHHVVQRWQTATEFRVDWRYTAGDRSGTRGQGHVSVCGAEAGGWHFSGDGRASTGRWVLEFVNWFVKWGFWV